ncbi:ferritin-like protein [Streptomyces echinoruber]|uniref:Membrane protein n=1 Tax=Streptomyces echinoruber TaxID=68898 RepID=A0A918QWR1_9ACTN|nr:ferritin-like protein [Streptomyces echinoruber]GGZ70499.1 membrane protein [Streptomyces echinoruber]
MTRLLAYESNDITELLQQPPEHRDADWLKDALQQAVMLELATLPPYLCGMWSIENPDEDSDVFDALKEVVFDEMSHLGLVGNLLTTIGGTPRLADENVVPKYPGPLPGGVRPGLSVSLGGLTRESLDMFSRMEQPEEPISLVGRSPRITIGGFYAAVLEAFRGHADLITGARQLTRNMAHHGAGNNVVAITSFPQVEAAIKVIREQGEGTSASPENPYPGAVGELAHFYVFREILHGRKLIRVSENPARWDFEGDEIRMPRTLPMGRVPKGGWGAGNSAVPDPETRKLLDSFNQSYSSMLRALEQAWRTDLPAKAKELLNKAVSQMFTLQEPARALMRRPLPGGGGKTYGPEFRYVDT